MIELYGVLCRNYVCRSDKNNSTRNSKNDATKVRRKQLSSVFASEISGVIFLRQCSRYLTPLVLYCSIKVRRNVLGSGSSKQWVDILGTVTCFVDVHHRKNMPRDKSAAQSLRHAGAVVGLAPQTKLQASEIETQNTINYCIFFNF